MSVKKIWRFFDKLEDKTRGRLSHYPIIYAFFGGVGVVLFWRGVWHTADDLGMDSITSLIVGSLLLLMIGVFVSAFIGNRLIISGLIGEKKLEEKEVSEIESEATQLKTLQDTLNRLEEKLEHIDRGVEEKK